MVEHILSDYSSNPSAWNQYLDHYKPPLQDDEHLEPRLRWRQHCRPIIQHAISLVSALRTPAWQKNPQREQIALPDIFAQRLRLLTYPSLYPLSQHEGCLDALASEVRTIIDELASSARPYHNQWELLISAIKQIAQRHWMPLALRLGKVEREDEAKELTLAGLLCIDAADELLTALNEKVKGKGLQAAEEMVNKWKGSGDEEVRRKGVRIAGLL
jgi:hypothetical protein